ncbi:uncharacterized protein LOC131429355 [Malaya genurostris]|uniref:uncharacterized protein LOC131429355 n=1 Tax=Malaya genurostris TaxID=325434 RepID=UPI0026F3BC92|nr:uncharacterized protein LOC131429355 [Malaya genurostris]
MSGVPLLQTQQENTSINPVQTNEHRSLYRAALHYDPANDYSTDSSVAIGPMNVVCIHCKALKFKNETSGLCCASGKVKLIKLNSPPEPLRSLVAGSQSSSKHFLENIQAYNSCFHMTSFGATHIIRDNFMPTFKVQGQIYHRAGSLLPVSDAEHTFLQIYFMGDSNLEANQRCFHYINTKKEIVQQLQTKLHKNNELIKLFKTALERMTSDNHKILIRADKTPVGEHSRRFNAPTFDDVAVVIVGENLQSRDIVLHRRSNELQRVSETHRCYDALQYPLLFWQGEDGYHFTIKMISPLTDEETNKMVSSMNFYSYRMMVRENDENHILKCRKLFHRYAVDMYKVSVFVRCQMIPDFSLQRLTSGRIKNIDLIFSTDLVPCAESV